MTDDTIEAKRFRIIKDMDKAISMLNDEDYTETWFALGIPDGSTDSDYKDYAQDSSTYYDWCELFASIISKRIIHGEYNDRGFSLEFYNPDADLRSDVENRPVVKFKKLHPDAVIPARAHSTDAGLDLYALDEVTVPTNSPVQISTGIAVELPEDPDYIWEAQIRPRSGLSSSTHLRISNTPGTIDAGYRGEIKIIMDNNGEFPYMIEKHKAVAQLVITRIPKVRLVVTDELSTSDRGAEGFGSTDKQK